MSERTITVDKQEILTVIKKNLRRHVRIHEKALAKWRELVHKRLLEEIKRGEVGKEYRLDFKLPRPVSYAKNYETIFGMLELDNTDNIELSEQEYKSYILDEWEFSKGFLYSNSMYFSPLHTPQNWDVVDKVTDMTAEELDALT